MTLQHCIYTWYDITTLYLAIIWHYNTIFSYNMTFEMSLFLWNFCECNVHCTFCVVYFTFLYYLFHLFWRCKHVFPVPIKPFELNWESERVWGEGERSLYTPYTWHKSWTNPALIITNHTSYIRRALTNTRHTRSLPSLFSFLSLFPLYPHTQAGISVMLGVCGWDWLE
jgi:hypothetical protein